jgi:hypothetical protein
LAHFVYRLSGGGFAGTRKSTGPRSYTARISKARTLDDARVFNTKAAATNAGSALGPGVALPVELLVLYSVALPDQ